MDGCDASGGSLRLQDASRRRKGARAKLTLPYLFPSIIDGPRTKHGKLRGRVARRRNPGAGREVGAGGGQLPAPGPARGALGRQGERKGGKWPPSGPGPGPKPGAGWPASAPPPFAAGAFRGRPTGGALTGSRRRRCAPCAGAGEGSPGRLQPGPALPDPDGPAAAPGPAGGRGWPWLAPRAGWRRRAGTEAARVALITRGGARSWRCLARNFCLLRFSPPRSWLPRYNPETRHHQSSQQRQRDGAGAKQI
ncbi:uncharacterized protein [Manis javanica]|uniref:uncharacterized protein n=1 Tax=Manis javanica TaxID=9974 RepID=UPI003C6D889D